MGYESKVQPEAGEKSEAVKVHRLKCLTEHFQAQAEGVKNYEIRVMDRDFKVGDEILLVEVEPGNLKHWQEVDGEAFTIDGVHDLVETGDTLRLRITSILTNTDDRVIHGLAIGFGILGTERLNEDGFSDTELMETMARGILDHHKFLQAMQEHGKKIELEAERKFREAVYTMNENERIRLVGLPAARPSLDEEISKEAFRILRDTT